MTEEFKKKLIKSFEEQEISFKKEAIELRKINSKFLKKHFGPKCHEFDPDCICCQRWKLLDDLLEC